MGSVRYASGVVNHYYPYGELVAGTNNTGFKFAETYRDDSGLDYALNRYYASSIGRFLSADRSGANERSEIPMSWNRYAYVEGDPVNSTDPTGEGFWSSLKAGLKKIGGTIRDSFEDKAWAYAEGGGDPDPSPSPPKGDAADYGEEGRAAAPVPSGRSSPA